MFGILWSLFGLGAKTANSIVESVRESESRERARKEDPMNPWATYMDNRGAIRLVSNGEAVRFDEDRETGDRIILSIETYKTLHNFSEDERQKAYKEAQRDTLPTAIKWEYGRNPKHKNGIKGRRYKDVKTGKIVVERNFDLGKYSPGKYSYWMDVETGLLIRPVDRYYRDERFSKKLEDIYKEMDRLNEQHKEIISNPNRFTGSEWWNGRFTTF